jgi:hypothetical protein
LQLSYASRTTEETFILGEFIETVSMTRRLAEDTAVFDVEGYSRVWVATLGSCAATGFVLQPEGIVEFADATLKGRSQQLAMVTVTVMTMFGNRDWRIVIMFFFHLGFVMMMMMAVVVENETKSIPRLSVINQKRGGVIMGI